MRWLLVFGAVAASLLLTVRALGPAWLAVITVVALAVGRTGGGPEGQGDGNGKRRLAELLRRRDTRWLLAGVSLIAVYAVAWLLFSGALEAVPATSGGGQERIEDMVRLMAVDRSSFWVDQIVGQFGYGETSLPSWLIISWYGLAAALVVPAAVLAGRRERWALVAVGALSALALSLLEVRYYSTLNWAQHGRYVMPLLVGLPLLAAVVGRYPQALGAAGRRALLRLVVLGTAPLHLFALALVMTRFQSGPGSPVNPFKGAWLPLLGPVPPLLALTAGLALLTWYALLVVPAEKGLDETVGFG